MPDAARVDRIVACAQNDLLRPVRQLLDQRDLAGGTDHRLVSDRMPLPARPALAEAVQLDEPSFVAIGGVAFEVGGVPFHAGEFGLRHSPGAKAEMDWETLQGELLHHGVTSARTCRCGPASSAVRKSVIRSGKGFMPFFCSRSAIWPR